jgi:hypothetical protein
MSPLFTQDMATLLARTLKEKIILNFKNLIILMELKQVKNEKSNGVPKEKCPNPWQTQ